LTDYYISLSSPFSLPSSLSARVPIRHPYPILSYPVVRSFVRSFIPRQRQRQRQQSIFLSQRASAVVSALVVSSRIV
jgi:hypothetical protein